MPTLEHELLIDLVKDRPEFMAEFVRESLGIELPDYACVQVESGEMTQAAPVEYSADQVIVLTDPARFDPKDATKGNIRAFVLEVQRKKDMDDKLFTWPVYLTLVRAQKRCPTTLVVFCPDAKTAKWADQVIATGHPDFALRPLVIGPENTPYVLDAHQVVEAPELAVMSALAHGSETDGDGRKVLRAFVEGLAPIVAQDDGERSDRCQRYIDYVQALLPDAAQAMLEEIMTETYEFKSPFFRRISAEARTEAKAEGLVEGEAKGEANAVLTVLRARRIEVPDDARKRIEGCKDPAQLNQWVERAATANSIDDLFA